MMVDALDERHRLSLVAFQTKSHILFSNAVPKEENKEVIKQQVDYLEIYLGGSTNMAAGIDSAMEALSRGVVGEGETFDADAVAASTGDAAGKTDDGDAKSLDDFPTNLAPADAEIILVVSDGEPISVDKAQAAAEDASQKGVQFYAVGIGDSYNAEQLLRLVTPSNGAVYGASAVENMGEIFLDLINRIDRIFATNVKVDFNFHQRAS